MSRTYDINYIFDNVHFEKDVAKMNEKELAALSNQIGGFLDDYMKGDKLYELYRYTPEKFKEKYLPICNELFGPITDFEPISETNILFVLSNGKKASVKISRKTRKVLKSSFVVYSEF